MKILLIGHEQILNGASRSLLNIADEFIARGHTIYVLTSYPNGLFYDELKRRDITVIAEPYYRWCMVKGGRKNWLTDRLRWQLKRKWINISTAKKVAKYALDNGIDVIHTNTSVINIGGLISKYSGIKHVWHIREFADLDFNMYPIIPEKAYYDFMNRYTDRFICVSEAVANHYNRLEHRKKSVIYNGVKNNSITIKDRIMRNSERTRILIAGMIHSNKGQHEAAAACVELYRRGISNFELLIAGSGKIYFTVPEYIKDKVVFLGQVEDMSALRKTIDIELMCSKAEAFGRVTAEAMLAGIPVIGSNTGGTPELIQDGITGFLYEKGNIEQLADKLSLLILNEKLRIKLGYASREIASSRFSIERCADEIEQVYRFLIP